MYPEIAYFLFKFNYEFINSYNDLKTNLQTLDSEIKENNFYY